MEKYFRIVAGVKFFCEKDGTLKKFDGKFKEVPEADVEGLEEVEAEDTGVEEVEKMLAEATKQVLENSEKTANKNSAKALEAINEMVNAFAKAAKQNTKTVQELTEEKASYDIEAVEKGIEDLATNQRNTFSFSIKSIRDLKILAKATSESGSLTNDVIEGDRVAEITRDPQRDIFIESISDVTTITKDHLSYVEVTNESGAPLPTAELGTIPEKDFEFTEFKAPLKKITVSNKHSVEILKDAPQLVAAIKSFLQEDVNIVVDQQLLNGSGTGNNLSGVFNIASVLDATAVGTKRVQDANLYDVIRVAITKIAVIGKGKFRANYVLLNPDDADELDLTKDANNNYILPPYRSADGTMIKGARVIENVGVEAGKFLVGDFRKLHVGIQGGAEIEMTNSDGTDFSKDILTVKIRRRIASYVRQNDSGAFWTGTIATVKAALIAS